MVVDASVGTLAVAVVSGKGKEWNNEAKQYGDTKDWSGHDLGVVVCGFKTDAPVHHLAVGTHDARCKVSLLALLLEYEAFGKERCSSSNSGTGGTGSTEEGHLPTSGASGASGATRPHTAAESGDDGDDDGQERKEQETVRLRTDLGND